MATDRFEGWAFKLSNLADHTWVNCPGRGVFVCWGSSSGPDNRQIVAGNTGMYRVANCYRRPLFGFQDTAGIIYGINGVCHQTANLYLLSAGTALNCSVRGYWASVLVYSVYGTAPPWGPGYFLYFWLATVYNPCYWWYRSMTGDQGAGEGVGDPLFLKLQTLYQDYRKESPMSTPHDFAVRELALITEDADPKVDPSTFEDLHREFLVQRDELTYSGVRGKELADRMNELARKYQEAISKRIGPEAFSSLTGQAPGEFLDVVDPEIAAGASKYES